MSNFKKFVAIVSSAAMMLSAPLTAFAEEPADPTSEAGTGAILAYSVETVTVPTTIKLAFNPMKLDFVTEGTTKVQDQVVSLNYGIASTATMDKDVTVKFKATATAGDGEEEVVFVDDIKKAQPYEASGQNANTDGAKPGEYKMYLAVAASTEAPKVDASNAFDTSTNKPTGANLSNVNMTAATKGLAVFEDGENASIAYKLTAAEYELDTGKNPTWTTVQGTGENGLDDMMKLKTLGSIVGFTFTGAMNEKADWTKVNMTKLSITPTYKITDSTGDEELLEANGGYQQIAAEAAVTELTGTYDSANLRYQITFPEGVTIADVSEVTDVTVNGQAIATVSTNGNGAVLRIARSDVSTALGSDWAAATDLEFIFKIDGTTYKSTIGRNG